MNIDISARGFVLTARVQEYAEQRFSALEHLHPRLSSVHVTLNRDDEHGSNSFLVMACITTPGGSVQSQARSVDSYEAVDRCIESLAIQLRPLPGRIVAGANESSLPKNEMAVLGV